MCNVVPQWYLRQYLRPTRILSGRHQMCPVIVIVAPKYEFKLSSEFERGPYAELIFRIYSSKRIEYQDLGS